MEKSVVRTQINKTKRALRVRSHVRGTALKPRLCVVKTNKHIQAQVIDDESGATLASISTFAKDVKKTQHTKKNKETAKYLGDKLAERMLELGISQVVFDRGPYKYHGVLAEFANAARARGLQF